VEIIGGAAITNDQRARICETEGFHWSKNCRRNYRNRINTFCLWLKDHDPEYFANGVREVTREDRQDPTLYFHDKIQYDLVYAGFNVMKLKIFLSENKMITKKDKKNGLVERRVLASEGTIRKYKDAIIMGSILRDEALPSSFYDGMKHFIDSYNKEIAVGKSKGIVDEKDSDALPIVLFAKICEWCLEAKNIFLWTWGILQWNLMCRPISVDPLSFHNFAMGPDCTKVLFDFTKADQEGSKVLWKHIYDNTNHPHVSVNLALGCWLALRDPKFVDGDHIFLNKNSKEGSASHRYCTQLGALLDTPEKIAAIRDFMRYEHLSAYSFRKGGAVVCTSDEVDCPSFVSTARRGEWSQGKIFDAYFQWAAAGDCFVGRVVRGVSPQESDFAALPPHWDVADDSAMDNPDISRAMKMCFKNILKVHEHTMQGPLLLYLASIVFHSEWLQRHDILKNIPILTDHALLVKLKKLVTLEPTKNMPCAHGVPSFVRTNDLIQKNTEGIEIIIQMLKQLVPNVADAVETALEQRNVESGIMTINVLEDRLFSLRRDVVKEVSDIMVKQGSHYAITANTCRTGGNSGAINNESTPLEDVIKDTGMTGSIKYCPFAYDGKFWHVPKDYSFSSKLVTPVLGWRLWLCGNSGFTDQQGRVRPILPYRKIRPSRIPKGAARQLVTAWRPLFFMMEQGLVDAGISIPSDVAQISDGFLDDTYVKGVQYVKSRASYIWDMQTTSAVESLSISYWSKLVSPSEIKKRGNESDKSKLEQEGRGDGRSGKRHKYKRL
jgi:hypothetical protein